MFQLHPRDFGLRQVPGFATLFFLAPSDSKGKLELKTIDQCFSEVCSLDQQHKQLKVILKIHFHFTQRCRQMRNISHGPRTRFISIFNFLQTLRHICYSWFKCDCLVETPDLISQIPCHPLQSNLPGGEGDQYAETDKSQAAILYSHSLHPGGISRGIATVIFKDSYARENQKKELLVEVNGEKLNFPSHLIRYLDLEVYKCVQVCMLQNTF